MALTLKLHPIEIETPSLGKILLAHWNLSAVACSRKFTALTEGSIRTFMEEFCTEFARKPGNTERGKRESYNTGQKLNNLTSLPDQEFELIAQAYIESEINNLLPYLSDNDKDREENDALRVRNDKESAQEHLRRLVQASLKNEAIQNKKLL